MLIAIIGGMMGCVMALWVLLGVGMATVYHADVRAQRIGQPGPLTFKQYAVIVGLVFFWPLVFVVGAL